MVKPTEDGYRDNLAAGIVLSTQTRNRDLLHNSLVRATRTKIVQSVLFKDVLHVPSSEDDDVIQAFAPGTANESFTNRILQGRLNRCAQYLDPSTLRNTIKFSPELAVIIANDELGPLTEWRDVPKLFGRPFRSWAASYTNVHNALRIDINHKERKDRPKPDIVSLQEIAGPDRMVSQERSPALAARKVGRPDLGQVSLDRPFRNSDAKLQQFAAYSFRTPQYIFSGHAVNECDDLRVNPRNRVLGVPRPPTPEKRKSLAVPTKYRFWLHEQQCVAPMWQTAREQNYETALMSLEDWTFDLPGCDN